MDARRMLEYQQNQFQSYSNPGYIFLLQLKYLYIRRFEGARIDVYNKCRTQ